MAKAPIASLSAEEQGQLRRWLADHGASLPDPVRIALEQHALVLDALKGTRHQLSQTLRHLRRALGITPQSERRRSSRKPLGPVSGGDGQRPQSLHDKIRIGLERLERLSTWHRNIARRQRKKMRSLEEKMRALPVAEVELSPEETAELEEENRQLMERFASGDGPEPSLQSVNETLMTGAQITTGEKTVLLPAPVPEHDNAKVVETLTEQRERHDFTLTVHRVVVNVEKNVVIDADGTRRILSASTATIGPPRYRVTWSFLTNMAVLVVQYAMPMNRLARMLSTDEKRFTAASLSRMLRYVAERFVPIYLQLFDELADSPLLLGDDTSPRVLEVKRYFANHAPTDPPPWHAYRNRAVAKKELVDSGGNNLEATLSLELGFEFPRRNGDGPKRSLNTTTISGRTDAENPESLIVFYRTHLGGFGNLLEMLLEKRNPRFRKLTVQSDLSTANLVVDRKLCKRFSIHQVGCSSHARRPFVLYEDEDPDACEHMVHLFKGLAIHEHGLDLHGRNAKNVAAVRGVDSRELWDQIQELAQFMTERWSPKTKLGEAARYILRHFDKLTAYLQDPRLEPTNNFSERMLRLEKLIQKSSMFRSTLGGRFVLDIVRTVFQTAIASGVPLQEYTLSILCTPPEEIEANPEQFTPHSWAKTYLDSENQEHLETEPTTT